MWKTGSVAIFLVRLSSCSVPLLDHLSEVCASLTILHKMQTRLRLPRFSLRAHEDSLSNFPLYLRIQVQSLFLSYNTSVLNLSLPLPLSHLLPE